MAITGNGWELRVIRLGQHQSHHLVRTYGSYSVAVNGKAVGELSGFVCECQGPGENDTVCTPAFRRRILAGTYPLYTHNTHYASVNFSKTATYPTDEHPMPCFGLKLPAGAARSGILVHPAHDSGLFLASIGCLNPTSALGPHDDMDIADSRARVMALLSSLKGFYAPSFQSPGIRRIAGASIIIEGEPLNWL